MTEIAYDRAPDAPAIEPIYVRMYYEHQYEALARVSNYGIWVTLTTLSLSVLVTLLAFDKAGESSIVVWLGAPLLMVAANSFAIIFLKQVRMKVGKMHIQRAKAVLQRYAPELLAFGQTPDRCPDKPRRLRTRLIPAAPRAQLLLHGGLVVFFLLAPLIYYFS
jgi:hypothetical protein